MGCLNSNESFSHWFGNIHLSGPCNRSCYFCIGQHMQSLESLNSLDTWPMPNLEQFFQQCEARGVKEVNLTGSNTDPLLFKHLPKLAAKVKARGMKFGIRTNGATNLDLLHFADKASVSIHSFNPDIYRDIMGSGHPPDLKELMARVNPLKLNIVLCPQNQGLDLLNTIAHASAAGIKRINVREPYGQPHIGDPLATLGLRRIGDRLGMPLYQFMDTEVTYWDVHYVEVESVNLYANGVISETYPITKGYDPNEGKVLDQSNWTEAKRHLPQWRKAG